MHYTRSWKHVYKSEKQYGDRNTTKYDTPFMVLDEEYLDDEEN